MVKIAGILFIIVSLSFYVFAHGTCTSIDADVVKCESLSQYAEPCSNVPDPNEPDNADTSVHVCGCVHTFLAVINLAEYGSFPEVIFGSLKFEFASSDFSQRIERPPIVRS